MGERFVSSGCSLANPLAAMVVLVPIPDLPWCKLGYLGGWGSPEAIVLVNSAYLGIDVKTTIKHRYISEDIA
jgi:hypothetical protein